MTTPIDIRADHLRIVQDVLARYLPDGVRVWVFGSRATWATKDSSDLDLALEGDGEVPCRSLSALEAAFEDSDLPFSVDVVDVNRIGRRFRRIVTEQRVPLPENGSARPTDWTSTNLGRACTKIGSGATPRGGKDVYLPNGPYALIRSQNVLNTGFRHDGLAYISDQHALDLDSAEVLNTDVLLNITGDSVARACQVDPHVLPARVNQHVAIIRPDPETLDPGFLRYSLVSPETQAKLLSWAGSGGTRQALTKAMIEAFDVRAPEDVREQHAIAYILGALDDKIELNRRMNATLEAMARTLFRSWFVDFDPVRAKLEGRDIGLPQEVAGLFPDRVVDSELGEIPESWEVSEIDAEVDIAGGATPSTQEPAYWDGGQHHWATPKDLSKLLSPVLLETARKITDAGVQKISSGLLPPGTVLLSSRAPIGYLAITEVPAAINQGFIAMTCRKRLPALYVLSWCYENLEHIKDISGGSTFAEISKKAFRPLPMVVPPKTILGVYDEATCSLHERIVSNARETALLASLRDALLPKLVSGELRVRDTEKLVEASA